MKALFASDGSWQAKAAALFLRQLKMRGQLQLAILTVSMPPELTVHGNIQNPEWEDQEKAFVTKHHAELEELFSSQCGDELSKLHQTGNSAHEILEVSKQIAADLIVMGAVGHSMVSRMLLGSVSDRVATHAKCSVLVVRPQTDTDTSPIRPVKKITVAYDGSVASREAINELKTMGWAEQSEVEIVTVVPTFDDLMGDGTTAAVLKDEQVLLERMRDDAEQISSQLAKTIPKTRARCIRGQHAGDSIVDFAEQNHSDLIIVGDAGHGRVHDWLIGSTTKYVLRHSHCSVWLSRQHRT
ncbi:universal stress protein [Novipirellula sp. SH528]|uniref:universal stress protein n=1 Tax=Novipirellula sp. SH528 TaxID=3454466 RepID=UPI003F9EF302